MKYLGTLPRPVAAVVLVLSLLGLGDCTSPTASHHEETYYGYRIRTAATRSEDGQWRSAGELRPLGGGDVVPLPVVSARTREEALDAAMSHAMAEVDRRRAAIGKP